MKCPRNRSLSTWSRRMGAPATARRPCPAVRRRVGGPRTAFCAQRLAPPFAHVWRLVAPTCACYPIGGRISWRREASAWPGSGARTSCNCDANDSSSIPAGTAAYACCTQVHGQDADAQQSVAPPCAGTRASRADSDIATCVVDPALSWHGGVGAVRSASAGERGASTRNAAICVDAIATVIPSRARTRHSEIRTRNDLISIRAGYRCRPDDRVTPHARLSGRQLTHEDRVNAPLRRVNPCRARSGRSPCSAPA